MYLKKTQCLCLQKSLKRKKAQPQLSDDCSLDADQHVDIEIHEVTDEVGVELAPVLAFRVSIGDGDGDVDGDGDGALASVEDLQLRRHPDRDDNEES